MRRVAITLAAALATAALLALTLGTSSAQASSSFCSLKKGGIVVAYAGDLAQLHCLTFNAAWHGRRFHGHFGQVRCTFYNPRQKTTISILNRWQAMGLYVCHSMTSLYKRQGFREVG